MSSIVNNNVAALKANRYLSGSNAQVTKAIEKLSSGYRINVGADDPSGLVISEQLRSQISGLERAVRNSSEASNVISIAEGALNEMNTILKKLRALAIHAANEGVTSPEQVEADQAEMDSGLQTLNRIANTTRYSDQNLLNGSKELVYDINTVVNEPTDHTLLNKTVTQVDQIWKTSGVTMTVAHNGSLSSNQANYNTSAQRAYLEADNAYPGCQISGSNITADQKFILTGTLGSKQFTFTQGESLGQVVAGINNSKDSTGVGAALIFASTTRIDNTATAGTAPDYTATPPTAGVGLSGYDDGTYTYAAGDIQIYGANTNDAENSCITSVLITPDAAESFLAGYNCDGDGKIYAKVVDAATNSIEYYKDADCTMLIGSGNDTFFSPANNSGIPGSPTAVLDGIYIDLTTNAQNHDVYAIALVGQQMDNQKDMDVQLSGWVELENSVMSGVNLGVNTDVDGTLHFEYVPQTTDAFNNVLTYTVNVYNSADKNSQNLVATSGIIAANVDRDAAGNVDLDANNKATYNQQTVTVESVKMPNGKESNLNLTLNIPTQELLSSGGLPNAKQTGTVSFTNLGMRLYATEYGSDEYIRIQNQEGELFYYYDAANTTNRTMITGEDTTMIYGQDALVTLNGTAILTNGLNARVATADFTGTLGFNSGVLGETTIAIAGYDTGSLYSRAQSLQALEESTTDIVKNDRYFEPMSICEPVPLLLDSKGNAVDLYLDFSELDPAVKQVIDDLGIASNISLGWDPATKSLTINAQDLNSTGASSPLLATLTNINLENLKNGMYVTDTALRGLYIKSSVLVDEDQSTTVGVFSYTQTVEAQQGDTLTEVQTWATNPRCSTSETMSNFQGGMQFQLGNTSGDQDRTVYSIQSMDLANVGTIEIDGVLYNLSNVQGGGVASLERDPLLAMKILEKAVDDVTNLRARLGAFQANMLETNINSLEVAVENLTLTESAIRDTDMAVESTNFTKNQILSQAGTSMLSQANQLAQNVLSLLQ